MSSFKSFIQGIPNWVTGFDSHWMFSYGFLLTIAVFAPHTFWGFVVAMIIGTGVKEFYVDKHFETTPQTFMMNLEDFGGYMFGLVGALVAHHFL